MNKTTIPKMPLTPERELTFNDTKIFKVIIYSKLIAFGLSFAIGYLYAYATLNYFGYSVLEVEANLSRFDTLLTILFLIILVVLGEVDSSKLKQSSAQYIPHYLWMLIPPVYIYLRQSKNDLGLKYFWIYLGVSLFASILGRIIV